MRKIILVSMLSAILIFSFSCKKDDKATTDTASFSAKVNGTLWTATNMLAGHQTTGNTSNVTGMGTTAAEMISLDFIGNGTGTYKMKDYNMGSVSIGSIDCTTFFSEKPEGEIVITKYDAANSKISGTFSFKAEDMSGTVYTIKEGKFENVNLVVQ